MFLIYLVLIFFISFIYLNLYVLGDDSLRLLATEIHRKSLMHMGIKTVSDPTEEKNKRFFVNFIYFSVLDLNEREKEGQIHQKGNAGR